MVESKAKVNILYRGFVVKILVSNKSDGRESVSTFLEYHVPEIKPELADYIDKRKTVETQEGEIECMRTHDTIGTFEADRLTSRRSYYPKYT